MTYINLHADSERTINAGDLSDYPARLLTRRVFSLSADQILQMRNRAPMGITVNQYQQKSQRPPC